MSGRLAVVGIAAQRSHCTVLLERNDGVRFCVRRDIWLDCMVVSRFVGLPDRSEPSAVDASPEEEDACVAVVSTFDTAGWDLSFRPGSGLVHALPPPVARRRQ